MSDDDRALVRRRETPMRGTPLVVSAPDDDGGSFEQEDHFTPVHHVIEVIEERLHIEGGVVLTERERLIVTMIWRHTANLELRARRRSDSSDHTKIRRDIDALETAITDIRGERGDNGKLGALKARVDQAESRRWWAITALAGVVVTVISASIAFGRWMSSVETDVEWLKQRRYISMPGNPAKENQ
jgi:hypothetical protein